MFYDKMKIAKKILHIFIQVIVCFSSFRCFRQKKISRRNVHSQSLDMYKKNNSIDLVIFEIKNINASMHTFTNVCTDKMNGLIPRNIFLSV